MKGRIERRSNEEVRSTDEEGSGGSLRNTKELLYVDDLVLMTESDK